MTTLRHLREFIEPPSDYKFDGTNVRDKRTGELRGHLQFPRAAVQDADKGRDHIVGRVKLLLDLSLKASTKFHLDVNMSGVGSALSAIGSAASIINLGVSAVGFAVVLHRLNRLEKRLGNIEEKLDTMGEGMEAVHAQQRRYWNADWIAVLRNCDEAFHSDTVAWKNNTWEAGAQRLQAPLTAVLLELLGDKVDTLLPDPQSRHVGQTWINPALDAVDLCDLLEHASLLIKARFELLLLCNETRIAIEFNNEILQQLSLLQVDPLGYIKPRRRGAPFTEQQNIAAAAEVFGLLDLIELLRTQARARRDLCETLLHNGVMPREFVEELRGYDGNEVLMLPAGSW